MGQHGMSRASHTKPAEAVIESGVVASLSHEGAGIVHAGKTAFIPGALPGENVRFRRSRRHRQYDEATLTALLTESPDRVTPRCAHFEICGGCALQHLSGDAQLRFKEGQLRDNLQRIARVAPERWLAPIPGPLFGYRRRARLGVRYVDRKERVLVGFRERSSSLIAAIERCEVLSPPVDGLISPLCALIDQLSIRRAVPQIEVAVADNAVALVLRVLQPPSAQDVVHLQAFQTRHAVRLYLQSGGIESVRALDPEASMLTYQLPDAAVELQFLPTDFIQVNAAVNHALVATALSLLELSPAARVLDLYCGLGNFSLPLARRAAHVVGVEADAGLVARARANARHNLIGNVEFHSADLSADVSQLPWARSSYSHVLIDPPRVGAREVLPLLARLAPARILYVSCHPATLARDVGILAHEHGYELLAAGVVDMFAHTAHVESIALLASP
jgi:23S rRNA (uracil1939-C5)-methyltransferase